MFTQDEKRTEQTWAKWTRGSCLWIERVQRQGSAERERRATAAASLWHGKILIESLLPFDSSRLTQGMFFWLLWASQIQNLSAWLQDLNQSIPTLGSTSLPASRYITPFITEQSNESFTKDLGRLLKQFKYQIVLKGKSHNNIQLSSCHTFSSDNEAHVLQPNSGDWYPSQLLPDNLFGYLY